MMFVFFVVVFFCFVFFYNRFITDLKPASVMCIWKATVQHKIPVHILYCIYPMQWNLQADVGYTIGLQLSSQMYFISYSTMTKITLVLN